MLKTKEIRFWVHDNGAGYFHAYGFVSGGTHVLLPTKHMLRLPICVVIFFSLLTNSRKSCISFYTTSIHILPFEPFETKALTLYTVLLNL